MRNYTFYTTPTGRFTFLDEKNEIITRGQVFENASEKDMRDYFQVVNEEGTRKNKVLDRVIELYNEQYFDEENENEDDDFIEDEVIEDEEFEENEEYSLQEDLINSFKEFIIRKKKNNIELKDKNLEAEEYLHLIGVQELITLENVNKLVDIF